MKEERGISAVVLKNTAVISMVIDHITLFLFHDAPWYETGRIIGRLAFVIYAFLTAQGALKTSDRFKYLMRLFLFGVISIVPVSYCDVGKPFDLEMPNVFFTLSLGLLAVYTWQWIEEQIQNRFLSYGLRGASAVLYCWLATVTNVEYGLMGVLLILVFHVFRNHKNLMISAAALTIFFGFAAYVILMRNPEGWLTQLLDLRYVIRLNRIQGYGVLALPLIRMYNGKRGKQLPKMFYYWFYPVHFALLALIRHFLGMI